MGKQKISRPAKLVRSKKAPAKNRYLQEYITKEQIKERSIYGTN